MTPNTPANHDVLILGAGLAGMAAALRLAERGLSVHLIETRKRLGGRASSFVDPATDLVLDQCQHAVMPACTHILDLYHRLGLTDVIEWHHNIHFSDGRNAIDTLRVDPLPAPFHLTRSFLSMRGMSLGDKFAIARGMSRMLTMRASGRRRFRGTDIASLLKAWKQPDSARRRFWDVIIISACNEIPENVDAELALKVFQEGFLASPQSVGVGLPRIPLIDLYQPLENSIKAAGGSVELGTSAKRLLHNTEGCVTAVETTDGRTLHAPIVITTLPPDRLAKLIDPDLADRDPRLRNLDQWTFSPIVAIHLFFDIATGPITKLPHLVTPDRPIDWVFNKGITELPPDATTSHHDPVQHLHALKSGAHDLVSLSADEIMTIAEREIRDALPGHPQHPVIHGRVIKEKVATFTASPQLVPLRPSVTGPIANLLLAGDWVDTGWPATMEGAVRSGYDAADAVLNQRNLTTLDRPDDMPASGLSRLLLNR
ncbi:MAG: hydroxysqualene dehydroxylase HpnE [Phycisphaeraceae bacterium]